MKMTKMTLTFDEETIEALRTKAKEEGFMRAPVFARYLLLRGLKESMKTELEEPGNKTVSVKVDNYKELWWYVKEKKLGSVANFATFAMEQYMNRVPLTEAQKKRVEGSIVESITDAV